MSRDPWLKELRIAASAANAALVEQALSGDLPFEALQHAGSAILRAERSNQLALIAQNLMEILADRDWIGDTELRRELEHYMADSTSELAPMPAALDELGDALDQSPASESFIEMTTGVLWPSEIVELGEAPAGFDPSSDEYMIVTGLGSRSSYQVMQRFVDTIEQPALVERLANALVGHGAFRRFQSELRRHEEQFTRWHRFRNDASLGHARSWLAERGYRSVV